MAESGLLGEDDVVKFINEMFGMGLSKESFIQPSGTVMCQLYEFFLADMGVVNLATPDLEACQGIDNIERFDEWFAKVNLYHAMNYILERKGFQGEFTMLDLLQPKRKKNLRILNYLVHAWIQYTDLKDAFQQNAKKFEDKAKEKDKLVVKIDTLKKTLEKKGAFAGTCRSKKAALDEQLGSITTEYELKRMLSNQLMLRYQAEKKELKTKQEEMSDLDVKLKKLQEEIIEMESQVIKSPEKIREEVIKQEGLLTVKSGEKRQLNSEYSAIVAQTENIDLAAQDMIPLMDHIKETITDMDAFKVKCSAVDDIKENITAKELKVQQQKVIIKQNSCNVMDMKDQIKKAVSKHGIRMKPMNTLLHEINEQIKKREDASSGPSKELVMKEKSLHQEIENIKDERAKLEQLIITMNERVAATHKKVEKQLRGNQG